MGFWFLIFALCNGAPHSTDTDCIYYPGRCLSGDHHNISDNCYEVFKSSDALLNRYRELSESDKKTIQIIHGDKMIVKDNLELNIEVKK